MKAGSKYHPLHHYFTQSNEDEITLTLSKIEQLVGRSLPATAYTQRAWWSNRERGAVQAQAWMKAGYHTAEIDLENKRITFRKPVFDYEIRREGNMIMWNSEMIRALRHHMGVSQGELAETLGVRQQTISEWETGMYEPKRAMSNLLGFVAERAGFEYKSM
jgi:DNA-binding transcriptional regulator YiaG